MWTPEQLDDQRGKRFVITGGNSGIGLEAAKLLAAKGGDLVLACRSLERGEKACEAVRAHAPGATVELVRLDLADLSSVKEAATELRERFDGIDVLVNNAGVMAMPRRTTADGFELQLGVNHLGHFALTLQVLDRVRDRVVSVSSLYHKRGRIRFDDLMGEKHYGRWSAYAQSKLANLLFTRELDHRLRHSGSTVRALACHPGYAATHLQTAASEIEGKRVRALIAKGVNALLAQDAERGGWPTVYASAADLPGGSYVGPQERFEMAGPVGPASRAPVAKDDATARRLWEVSEELTGVRSTLAAAA